MKIADQEALDFLVGRNSLLDSQLLSFSVSERDDVLMAELMFLARPGAEYDRVKLVFEGVTDFAFVGSDDYVFGNVEDLKLTTTKDAKFYLSIDPDTSSREPSAKDGDFVKGRKIWAQVYRNDDEAN